MHMVYSHQINRNVLQAACTMAGTCSSGATTMQEASADAREAVRRAGDFLEEFRAVGGMRGAQNRYISLTEVFERSNARIEADLGVGALHIVAI